MLIDAHLDIAYNAQLGRNVLKPAAEQPGDEGGIPTVGLPDLRSAVSMVCATIFAEPKSAERPGYTNADEAHAAGWWQMQWYLERENEGHFTVVRSRTDLPGNVGRRMADGGRQTEGSAVQHSASDIRHPTSDIQHSASDIQHPLPAVILLEGADPIRTPAEVPFWYAAGVRIVGLAWRQTRYAGGTGCPGPLTPAGVDLIKALDAVKMIHDTSHLAEESFWQLLHLTRGPVMASHSNCRAIVPTDRQLSDEMIRALALRGGVIGVNFFDRFLIPPEQAGRRATLADVVAHVNHIVQLLGNVHHVAIGTDMDGGLGRNEIPEEITTSADLPKLADALADAGYSDQHVQQIIGRNWAAFFARHLP